MKTIKQLSTGVLLLASAVIASEPPKTLVPEKVPDSRITDGPYCFNGVVLNGGSRASGFCAWDRKTFFSAASFVFDPMTAVWAAPPVWNPLPNSLTLDSSKSVRSRGYYRWTNYSTIVARDGSKGDALARDVILGFAFKNLIPGPPAKLNPNGAVDLKLGARTMITGYPFNSAYTGEDIAGYFLHKTGPSFTTYRTHAGHALEVALVSTGAGTIGGPVWTKDPEAGWAAAGVLVRSLPSESIVCAFASGINTLTRAVDPIVNSKLPESNDVEGVAGTSRFFVYDHEKTIPDGVQKWTELPLFVDGFKEGDVVKEVRLSMKLKTTHRGDLKVALAAPGGHQKLIHNEQGGLEEDLIFTDRDLSGDFSNIQANGRWTLRVQDRLVGDVARFKDYRLEISAVAGAQAPP